MAVFAVDQTWRAVSDAEMLIQVRGNNGYVFLYAGDAEPASSADAFRLADNIEPRQFKAPSSGSWWVFIPVGTTWVVVD